MFNRRTAVMVLAIALTIIFAVLLFSCQETDNGGLQAVCELGEIKPCIGRTLGECDPGQRQCQETYAGGTPITFWSECLGVVEPTEEVCDYKDNDCDNRIDNGVQNACGNCGPIPIEECDDIDNDCDGEVDEGFADFEELCDGYDNDCDGVVDEGLSKRRVCDPPEAQSTIVYNDDPNSRSTCTHGWQECREGDWTECADWTGPQPEICDGWDNDCNGYVDEIEFQRNQCGLTDVGICDFGYEVCVGGEMACWETIDPEPEACDNLDNDCDGTVDEELERGCQTACGRGAEVCIAGEWVNCSAPPSVEEICDGEDNDCDGLVDEDLTCLCNYGDVNPCPNAPCGWGLMVCQEDGTWGECTGNIPQEEVCNAHDDNCNQLIDEDLVLGCFEDDPALIGIGICLAGTSTCELGVWGPCEGQQLPEEESCDGIDNDCDGVVDDLERFYEKVDMVFAIDISGSMISYIRALKNGVTDYVLGLQGTEHQFGIVLFGGNLHPQGEGYVLLNFTNINTFITTLDNLAIQGVDEPSLDTIRDIADPLNPLGLNWRADATPIAVLIGDENPQTNRGLEIGDVVDYAQVCLLPGCNSATNPNWTDGDPLEFFAFVLSPYMGTWEQVAVAPGQRVFNIFTLLNEEQMAINLSLLFKEICIDP